MLVRPFLPARAALQVGRRTLERLLGLEFLFFCGSYRVLEVPVMSKAWWEDFREWLKWCVAGEELRKLEQYRTTVCTYRMWLAEFKDISTVLDNLNAEVEGGGYLNASSPPGEQGPWEIASLREVVRSIRC